MLAIGTDIVEMQRFERLYQKFPQKLPERILTAAEMQLLQSRLPVAARFLAKQFAAKEAVSKALGTGISGLVTFKGIEVLRTPVGAPVVTLYCGALAQLQKLGFSQVHLSLSDEKHYGIAMVVLS